MSPDTRWHHNLDAPPEHFCEDCDRAVRMLGLATICAERAEAELARLRRIEAAARRVAFSQESDLAVFSRFATDTLRAALQENKYASPELIAAVEALPEYDPEKHGPLRDEPVLHDSSATDD